MPDRCVVYGCDSVPDISKGISAHRIPFWNNQNPEAKRCRKVWVDFIRTKRAKFIPAANSAVCSFHFKPDDFEHRFSFLLGLEKVQQTRLKRNKIGVLCFPTIFRNVEETTTRPEHRKQLKDALQSQTASDLKSEPEQDNTSPDDSVAAQSSNCFDTVVAANLSEEQKNETTQTETQPCYECGTQTYYQCQRCKHLSNWKRIYKNRWAGSKQKISHIRTKFNAAQREISRMKQQMADMENEIEIDDYEAMDVGYNDDRNEDASSGSNSEDDVVDDEMTAADDLYESGDESDEDQEPVDKNIQEDRLRTEPKFLVFLSKLLLLFTFCPICKADNPLVQTKTVAIMVQVILTCANEKCSQKDNVWYSQPWMPGSRIAAGNFLLSFSTLVSGGCASKIFQIFKNMGLCCISLKTFFKHQKETLFPAIYLYWQKYQKAILSSLRATEDKGLVIAGDGRHDSMGHSAKYGTYTIFCCNNDKIIDFSLVQRSTKNLQTWPNKMTANRLSHGYSHVLTTYFGVPHQHSMGMEMSFGPNSNHF
ncbi:uncharacterized protein LOC135694745 isoform X1 [Rhopilema esculentum]|uniref:uncharacterized protein LOC135694745 isoform X1 n=1 Tax=Rhopilema esculentum TaxID=499914 RepID=UPI0031D3AF02